MPILEGIRIQNYRVLKDVTLGRTMDAREAAPLTPLTAVIGKNGVGKSSLFDAFGFLADCLTWGVEEACDESGRGGFDRIRSQGSNEPIMFQVYYREEPQAPLVFYGLNINSDDAGRPFVAIEFLFQMNDGDNSGTVRAFLLMSNGFGVAWKEDALGQAENENAEDGFDLEWFIDFMPTIEESLADTESDEEGSKIWLLREFEYKAQGEDREIIQLQDNRRLGIATLGALKQHPRIAAFREFLEGWYLSYFTPDAARGLPMAGPQRRLSVHGDNLGNVVQYMERENRDGFDRILRKIAARVPGIDRISTVRSPDGRLLLQFNDRGFVDPFYASQMSDGTLKLFAYLLLMEDPNPPPLICIEEPENGLYHKLLEVLAAEFRAHATGESNTPQIFVTTHHPYLVDALTPEEVWVLEKGEDGFATISRASDDKIVKAMVEEGLPLGSLWYSDYLDPRQSDAF